MKLGKSIDKYTDDELLVLINSNKKNADIAYTEIYNRYSNSVYKFCYFYLKNQAEAEDVFQEVFVKYFTSTDKSPESVNIKSYLLKSAKNHCLNKLRQSKVEFSKVYDNLLTLDIDYLEEKELKEQIRLSIDLLDDKYREAFILKEIENMTFKEIGEHLDITLSGAQSRVVRAKEQLVSLLEPYLKELK